MDARDLEMLKPEIDEREVLTERLIKDYGFTHQLLDPIPEDEFFEFAENIIGVAEAEPIPVSCNQPAKDIKGKPRLTLVPRRITWAIAAIREFGTEKYKDPDNWRLVDPEEYRNAAYRHLLKYLDDPNGVDTESGYSHLWHLACNVAFLIEMEGKA